MSRKSRIQGKPHNISKNELVNGMVVTFSYASSSSDKNPLVLFLYEENNLMHCINLNYLPTESSVQELFNEINKSTSITVGDNLNVGSSHTLVGLHHKKTPGELNPKVLYENYLKNNFLKKYSNCYRTYNKSKVGVLKAVNYKLDVVEKEFRKLNKLSKTTVSSDTIYDNISDSETGFTSEEQ
tara:strand:+ start:2028 stop:2576 length:549 start_codon:yes stop_codon:yes gene_type:complete